MTISASPARWLSIIRYPRLKRFSSLHSAFSILLIMHLLKMKQEPVSESCFFIIICSTFIICNPKSQVLPGPAGSPLNQQPRHFPAQFSYSVRSKRSIWKFFAAASPFPLFPPKYQPRYMFFVSTFCDPCLYAVKSTISSPP